MTGQKRKSEFQEEKKTQNRTLRLKTGHTCQFNNYDLYAANLFNAEHKYERREKQFPIDLENCRQLGARLVEKAKEAQAGTLVRERLRLPEEFLKEMHII